MRKTNFLALLSFSVMAISGLAGCQQSKSFTIKFVNYDGTVLQEYRDVEKGSEVEYTLNKPYRYDDDNYYYVFTGWDKDITPAFSDVTYTATFEAKALTNVTENPVAYEDVLPADTKDGSILHAFCWSYENVREQLPFIARAGYKSVQIMPVQTPKNNGASWWAFYQPLSFHIADGEESPLGTKQDLIDLCDEAEDYNISIIADIVFNHMANIGDDELEPDGTPKVCPDVGTLTNEPYIYEHRNDSVNPTFHHHNDVTSGCGAETQKYPFGGLPDLNTSNEYVQERALSLLKECIDVGIDGFRFDAAKHIETPDDPEYASNFWTNTLDEAKTYYYEKTGKELFAYGEVLGNPSGRSIDVYTKLMSINDDGIGSMINYGALDQKAENAVKAKTKVDDASKVVGWLESHDNYVNNPNPFANPFMARSWSVLATKKGNRGLYLARPDSASSPLIGSIGDYWYRSEELGTVNRFHNRFYAAEGVESFDGSIYINEKYTDNDKGAVVTNFGEGRKIVVDFSKLGTDVYYDQMTGKNVTVREGHATIELAKNGIAVLTKSKNGPYPTLDIEDRNAIFVDTKDVVVNYTNSNNATYKINDGTPVAFSSGDAIRIKKEDADVNKEVKLTIVVQNDKKTIEETVIYRCETLVPGYFNVLNISEDHLTNYDIYIWTWNDSGSEWIDDYIIQDGKLLIDVNKLGIQNMLLARFPKNHIIEDIHKWDSGVIKQTTNITGDTLSLGYYDGSAL